jgi:hypothetical protein
MYDRSVLRSPAAGWMLAAILGAACAGSHPAETVGRGAAKPAAPPGVMIPAASPDAPSVGLPPRPRFGGRISSLPATLRREMRGTTWKPGCPVSLDEVALLRFNYWTFDGEIGRGPIVVHEDVAEDVLWVFRRLFRARFPIKRLALAREFVPMEFEPVINSRRSVTAAFNCRPVITPRGPLNDFSRHSYGMAIDINPVQNPFVDSDGFVRNRASRRYLDRSRQLEGMIHDEDVVVRSFARIGWEWGGHWSGGKDYMHFAVPG